MEAAFCIARSPTEMLNRLPVQKAKYQCVTTTLKSAHEFLMDSFVAPRIIVGDDPLPSKMVAVVDGNGVLWLYAYRSHGSQFVGRLTLRRSIESTTQGPSQPIASSQAVQVHDGVVGLSSSPIGDLHGSSSSSSSPPSQQDQWQYVSEVIARDVAPNEATLGGTSSHAPPPRDEEPWFGGNTQRAPTSQVTSLCFSANCRQLACGWLDGHLTIVQLPNDTSSYIPSDTTDAPWVWHCLNLHNESIDHIIAIHQSFVTASADGTFNVVPVDKGYSTPREVISSARPHPKCPIAVNFVPRAPVTSLYALPPDSFLVGTADGHLVEWSVSDERKWIHSPKELTGPGGRSSHDAEITNIVGTLRLPLPVSIAGDGTVRGWKLEHSQQITEYKASLFTESVICAAAAATPTVTVTEAHGQTRTDVHTIIGRENGTVQYLTAKATLPLFPLPTDSATGTPIVVVDEINRSEDQKRESKAPLMDTVPNSDDYSSSPSSSKSGGSMVNGVVLESVRQLIWRPALPSLQVPAYCMIIYRSMIVLAPLPQTTPTTVRKIQSPNPILIYHVPQPSPHQVKLGKLPYGIVSAVIVEPPTSAPLVILSCSDGRIRALFANTLQPLQNATVPVPIAMIDSYRQLPYGGPSFFAQRQLSLQARCFADSLSSNKGFTDEEQKIGDGDPNAKKQTAAPLSKITPYVFVAGFDAVDILSFS
jgi:hypothetical protein